MYSKILCSSLCPTTSLSSMMATLTNTIQSAYVKQTSFDVINMLQHEVYSAFKLPNLTTSGTLNSLGVTND